MKRTILVLVFIFAVISIYAVTNIWDGSFNRYWSQQANWSLNHVPTAEENVIIPAVGYHDPMYVDIYDAECNNLTIESGVEFQVKDQALTVNGDLTVSGHINMLEDSATITVIGSVNWESGSELTTTVNNVFLNVYGDWNFESGANVNPTQGYIDFEGSGDSWIRCYSSNSSFYRLRNYKSGGGKITFSNASTQDIVINNLLFTNSGSITGSMSSHAIIMRGAFNYYGTFDFTELSNTGSVVFDGTTQSINNYSSGSGVFNNVVFSASSSATLYGTGITVAGDLTIEQGTFNSANYPVTVGGNWNNTGGTYSPGTSLVTFDSGGDHQDVDGTNTFYDIQQVDTGYYLRFNGNTTIHDLELNHFCWAYDTIIINGILNIDNVSSKFTANGSYANATIATLDQGGTIFCNGEATITINDLVESRIMGTYYAYDVGGTINLSNAGAAVDLQADLYIYGGTMNIAGSVCWWPYLGDASITMTDGVIDVTSCGIYLPSSYTLTSDITGGTIRTAYGFTGNQAGFNPSGGTIELYGTTNADISHSAGSSFYNVLINKAVSDDITRESKEEKRIVHNRDGSVVELTRDNKVNATSLLDIHGDFIIDSGIFDTNGHNMSVAGDWMNNVGDAGFLEGTKTVTFDGENEADILTSETFYNMIVNKTTPVYDGLELTTGNSIHVLNDLTISDGTFEMNQSSILNVEDDVQINLNAGLNAYSDIGLNLYVGGNWTNDNTTWNTIVGYSPGTETITFYGNTDQIITTAAPQEDFGNLVIDKTGGEFRSNDNIHVLHDLDITTGNWHDNVGSLTHYFEGDVYVTEGSSAGFNSTTGNTVVFKGTTDQTVYYPYGYYYFHDVIVDKTAWPTRSFENHEGTETQLTRLNDTNLNDETRALTVTLTSSLDMQMGNGLTIEEGTLDLNGNTFYTMGDVIINDGGTIVVDEGAQLRVYGGDELNVNSGGTLKVLGTSSNLATVTHRSTGNYDFNIYSGGTISAEYGLFEYMTDNGVYVWEGGIVDPSHSFDYCTFQNGYVGPGTLLYINNYDNITITGANFPDNASSDYNVAKVTEPPAGQGYITMVDYTGIFSGEDNDYDPYNRINWGGLPAINDLTIQYSAGNIILNWTYPETVDHFNIYRSTNPYDFSSATIFTTTSVGYSEPATGTKYFYYVTAVNGADDGVSRGNVTSSDSAPWSK